MLLRIGSLLLVTHVLAWSIPARAHDPWESNGFSYNPARPDQLVLRTNRGLAFSDDGGDSWRFLCRGAFSNFIPGVGSAANGAVLLGTFDGLASIGATGCNEQVVDSPMNDLWVSDLVLDPTATSAWVATTSRGEAANGVFRSTDHGQTWSALGTPELGPFFKRVRLTADGQRMYVGVAQYFASTDTTPEHVDYSVRYSDDQGASWTSFPVALEPDDLEMVLLDVDPENPDRVFIGIHVCREGQNGCFDPARGQRMDSVLVSEDRGHTWTKLFEVREIASFEIDDQHIWVGDWWGGLWRMDRDGENQVRLHEYLKAGCVMSTDRGLFVCGSDVFGFMLARSDDDGSTLTPVATSSNILGNPVCNDDGMDAGPSIAAVCDNEWGDLCREAYSEEPNPPLECAGHLVRMDAGTGPGDPGGGGCSCSAAGGGRGRTPGAWFGAGWLAVLALGAGLIARRVRRTGQPMGRS